MSSDQFAEHIKTFVEDEELMNNEIPEFILMFMLFSSGVMPGSRRSHRRESDWRGRGLPITAAVGSSRGRSTTTEAENSRGRSSIIRNSHSSSTTTGRSRNYGDDDGDFVSPPT